jgi:hypothetical protein
MPRESKRIAKVADLSPAQRKVIEALIAQRKPVAK